MTNETMLQYLQEIHEEAVIRGYAKGLRADA